MMTKEDTKIETESKSKKIPVKRSKKSNNENKKLKDKIKDLQNEKNELNDKYLRIVAEFDNYKKRTDKEYISLIQNANEQLITNLLPIVDDLERSLDHLDENNDFDALVEGFKLIYKNLSSALEKQGLKPLQSIGEDFDPDKHDALLQTENDGVESNKVVDEHLKGYVLIDKVIRHAQVIVSK